MNPKWKRSGVVFVSQNLKWETHILLSCYGFICKLSDMSGFATFPEVFSSMTKLQRRWKYRLFLELFVCSMNAIVPGVKTKCVDIELIHVALRRVATIVSFYLENNGELKKVTMKMLFEYTGGCFSLFFFYYVVQDSPFCSITPPVRQFATHDIGFGFMTFLHSKVTLHPKYWNVGIFCTCKMMNNKK